VGEPDAAVAILRTRGPDPSVLLIRRAEREGDSWSGHWSLPGGRRDSSDIDPLHTALRELEEECGIRLSREQRSATLPPMLARRRTGPFLLVAPFVFEIDAELPTVLDANEAAGARWIPERTLLDPAQHSFQRASGLPDEVWFPAIVLPGAPLWGFTYRLLMDWLGVCPPQHTRPGFDVACLVLDFLLSRGLILHSPWHMAAAAGGDGLGPVHLARVSGPIPAESLIEHFSAPGAYVAKVNRLEVRPEHVRIHGLSLEEYLIEAITDGGAPPAAWPSGLP
jgi:8-oxo-dGTP pyrophosphatase MutT (NUDIX family)